MFGRVRPSSTSLDCLERPASKILKDDSMSIYEATLLKLKQGAQRELTHPSNHVREMVIDSTVGVACVGGGKDVMATSDTRSTSQYRDSSADEEMMTSSDCSTLTTVSSTIHGDSECISSRGGPKNVSVLGLFRKFESAKRVVKSSYEESIAVEHSSPSITRSLVESAQTLDSSTSLSVCE